MYFLRRYLSKKEETANSLLFVTHFPSAVPGEKDLLGRCVSFIRVHHRAEVLGCFLFTSSEITYFRVLKTRLPAPFISLHLPLPSPPLPAILLPKSISRRSFFPQAKIENVPRRNKLTEFVTN